MTSGTRCRRNTMAEHENFEELPTTPTVGVVLSLLATALAHAGTLKPSRQVSLAKTKIEEAMHWLYDVEK